VATEQQQPARGSERPTVPSEKAAVPLVVERITHQDVPAICALYKKVWDPPPAGIHADYVKSWQPTPLEFTSWMEGVTYFAARRDGRVIGIVGCELRHASCRMMNLAVDPETRRQGVASALIAAAIEWAKKGSCSSIWIDSLSRFAPSTGLFQHLGFAQAGVLHKHEWGEDVNLFERTL
jgi:[ribosomal protein S18]-alanine N-acetyltransferase